MPRKLIIDTDPGIDDAMAIYVALASPELDVVGLTTVFGNVEVDLATTNALRLLEIAGRADVPVAEGAAGPIASDFHGPIPHVHGADGQGDTDLPPPVAKACDRSAVELLIEASSPRRGADEISDEQKLTILALGPLTNLALALEQDPGLAERVEEVVIMGGNALVPGNATPAAEANIWNDPEAADFVFGCFPRLAMVGLDVTQKVVMSGEQIATLGRAQSTAARHLEAVVRKYLAFFRDNHGRDGIMIHDPAAVAYLIDRSLFTIESWPIRVEVEGLSRGKTWPSLGNVDRIPKPWQGRPRIDVCVGVEAGRVNELVLGRLMLMD